MPEFHDIPPMNLHINSNIIFTLLRFLFALVYTWQAKPIHNYNDNLARPYLRMRADTRSCFPTISVRRDRAEVFLNLLTQSRSVLEMSVL